MIRLEAQQNIDALKRAASTPIVPEPIPDPEAPAEQGQEQEPQ